MEEVKEAMERLTKVPKEKIRILAKGKERETGELSLLLKEHGKVLFQR